jgi:CRP/FNR family transcriptional regulator, cyclic AMP receptor protein
MSIQAVFVNAQEQRAVPAGEAVFAQGDTGREMYGLISGAVILRQGDRVIRTLQPGDTFGEMAVVSEEPRSLTAEATEPSVLAVIDERTFLFLVHETPMFAVQVMRSLAEVIRTHDAQR